MRLFEDSLTLATNSLIKKNTSLDNLQQYIESLIFVAEQPLPLKEIKYILENNFNTRIPKKDLEEAMSGVIEKYASEQFGIEVVEIANGYQFLTKPAFHSVVGTYLKQITKKRLSRAALETLSIIAYKQPVAKSEVEKIRGVSCDYSVQKLLEKELIEITGRGDGPGRPLMYSTSEKFMNYFGLKNIEDLPKLKDFELVENQIGEPAPIEEIPGEIHVELNSENGNGDAHVMSLPVKNQTPGANGESLTAQPERDTDLLEGPSGEVDENEFSGAHEEE